MGGLRKLLTMKPETKNMLANIGLDFLTKQSPMIVLLCVVAYFLFQKMETLEAKNDQCNERIQEIYEKSLNENTQVMRELKVLIQVQQSKLSKE